MPYVEEVVPAAAQASLKSQLDAWITAPKPGPNLKSPPLLFPPSLDAASRKFVHSLCESITSVRSESEGKGPERRVKVYDEEEAPGVIAGVPGDVRAELTALLDGFTQGEELHFSPALGPAGREYVHKEALKRGLRSKSEGVTDHGEDWHIVVR